MNNKYYCIIMAGGVGSRFWPLSRQDRPKQFLDILGIGKTFIQMTYERYARIVPAENILIVTSDRYSGLIREQLPQVSADNILLEPYKRNTAPCIAYATYKLYQKCPDATVVVAPSDHYIVGETNFEDTIRTALDTASKSGNLFTIGIDPTRPETNYGYIQVNKQSKTVVGDHESYQVKTFTEKPNADLAKVFLETGEFFWNSGMFIWNLSAIKAELESNLPEVANFFKDGGSYFYTDGEKEFIRKAYEECPSISIDYGVMEKTRKAWVFLSNFGWSDLGTWGSLYDQSPNRDAAGNIIKCGEAVVDEVSSSIVHCSDTGKLVVMRGFDNVLVVDMDDVLLICHRDDKSIKDIVTDLSMNDKIDKFL